MRKTLLGLSSLKKDRLVPFVITVFGRQENYKNSINFYNLLFNIFSFS